MFPVLYLGLPGSIVLTMKMQVDAWKVRCGTLSFATEFVHGVARIRALDAAMLSHSSGTAKVDTRSSKNFVLAEQLTDDVLAWMYSFHIIRYAFMATPSTDISYLFFFYRHPLSAWSTELPNTSGASTMDETSRPR